MQRAITGKPLNSVGANEHCGAADGHDYGDQQRRQCEGGNGDGNAGSGNDHDLADERRHTIHRSDITVFGDGVQHLVSPDVR